MEKEIVKRSFEAYSDDFHVETVTVLDERCDDVTIVGCGWSVLASMDESGKVFSFTLLDDDEVVLSLSGDEYVSLGRALSLLSGEQMRNTVEFLRKGKTNDK